MDGTQGGGGKPPLIPVTPQTEPSKQKEPEDKPSGAQAVGRPSETSQTPVTHRRTRREEPKRTGGGATAQSAVSTPPAETLEAKKNILEDALVAFNGPVNIKLSERSRFGLTLPPAVMVMAVASGDLNNYEVPFRLSERYAQDQYRAMDESMTSRIRRPDFSEFNAEDRINFLLASLVVKKNISDAPGYNDKAEAFLKKYDFARIRKHLEVMELYKTMVHLPPHEISENQWQTLYQLALETHFTPAVSFLLGNLLLPDRENKISPARVLALLNTCHNRTISVWQMQAMGLQHKDIMMVRAEPTLFEGPQNLYHQALWCFSGLIACELRPPLRLDNPAFPHDTQNLIQALLSSARLGYQIPSKDEQRKLLRKIKSEAKNPEEQRMYDALFNPQKCRVLVSRAKEPSVSLKPYPQALVLLVLGLHAQHQFMMGEENPLKSAEYFVKAAGLGDFPELYQEAANIYMGFGCYERAIECLQKYQEAGVKPGQEETISNQLELCELQRDEQLKLAEELMASSSTEPSDTRRRKRKGKKQTRRKPHPPATPRGSKPEKSVATIEAPPLSDTEVESETEIPPDNEVKSKPKPKLVAAVASAAPEPTYVPAGWRTGEATVKSTLFGKLRRFRDCFDVHSERLLIDQSLQESRKSPLYGRVCEEAAWFYLRNAGLMTPGRKQSPPEIRKELWEAEKYLCDALGAYINRSVGAHLSPAHLEQLISNYYRDHPEHAQSPALRIRLRSICSSFGHLYSELAGHSHGKNSVKLSSIARDFYRLKTLADPEYHRRDVPGQQSKLQVVSAEEFARLKSE